VFTSSQFQVQGCLVCSLKLAMVTGIYTMEIGGASCEALSPAKPVQWEDVFSYQRRWVEAGAKLPAGDLKKSPPGCPPTMSPQWATDQSRAELTAEKGKPIWNSPDERPRLCSFLTSHLLPSPHPHPSHCRSHSMENERTS
jgi:hypothetical protein